jgi:hypothetical protein
MEPKRPRGRLQGLHQVAGTALFARVLPYFINVSGEVKLKLCARMNGLGDAVR